ncbi:MAG: PilW family protein [Terriglobales bacterium]
MIGTHSHGRLRRNAGFSLIELMIALLLGVIVVAGLINVLIANRQAYHLQEANNYNQQNMRFAMDRIGWSLRMADFWGGVTPTSISGSPTVTGGTGCDAAWVLAVAQGIYGYDGSTGSGGFPLTGCVNDANYVSGSDVLVVRYADTDAVPASGGTTGLTPSKVYLQVQTGNRGILFTDTRPSDLPNTTQGVSTYPYAVEMYYLRPCSDLGSATTCSASSDGSNPIPTLMRLRLDDTGALVNEPVVEGIEQLQFEYGIRDATTPDNPVPVKYESASDATTNNDWANVVAVRIGYVLRAATRDTRLPHTFDSGSTAVANATYPARLSTDCQYSIDSAGTITIAPGKCIHFAPASVGVTGQAQQYTRTQMTSVVQVRNRIR